MVEVVDKREKETTLNLLGIPIGEELTHEKIENILINEMPSVALGKLSPRAFLALVSTGFKIDSPVVIPFEQFKRMFTFGKKRFYIREAKKFLMEIKKFLKEKDNNFSVRLEPIPDDWILEILKKFGWDKDKILNLINLENAIIYYTSEHINHGKELFGDHVFMTLVRLYFAELMTEMRGIEEIFEALEITGYFGRRHVNLTKKEFEDMIEINKWKKLMERVFDRKINKISSTVKWRDKTTEVFTWKRKKPVKGITNIESLLGIIGRINSLVFSVSRIEPITYRVFSIFGRRKRFWVREGETTITLLKERVKNYKEKDVRALPNKEFIELVRLIPTDKITTVGLLSAITKELANANKQKNSLSKLIIESSTFTTLLRLYFAALIQKLAIIELMMVVFGETTIMTRFRKERLSSNFESIVNMDFYKELIKTHSKKLF